MKKFNLKEIFSKNSPLLKDKKLMMKVGAVLIVLIAVISTLYYNSPEQQEIRRASEFGRTHADEIYEGLKAIEKDEDLKRAEIQDEVTEEEIEARKEIVYVDVGGAVMAPKLAELKKGARYEDAINAAGGLTKDADVKQINRAKLLEDGQRVYIPRIGEKIEDAPVVDYNDLSNHESGWSNSDAKGKININKASSEELQSISGIGPSTAKKIIDYRTKNGSFRKISDLKKVSGIGEKTFEKMKDSICV